MKSEKIVRTLSLLESRCLCQKNPHCIDLFPVFHMYSFLPIGAKLTSWIFPSAYSNWRLNSSQPMRKKKHSDPCKRQGWSCSPVNEIIKQMWVFLNKIFVKTYAEILQVKMQILVACLAFIKKNFIFIPSSALGAFVRVKAHVMVRRPFHSVRHRTSRPPSYVLHIV